MHVRRRCPGYQIGVGFNSIGRFACQIVSKDPPGRKRREKGKRPKPPELTSIMESIAGYPPERSHPLTRDGCCTLGRNHILWAEFEGRRVFVARICEGREGDAVCTCEMEG